MTICNALWDTAIGETWPIALFQMTMIPPYKPSANRAAQSQLQGVFEQSLSTQSELALVSTKQMIMGLYFQISRNTLVEVSRAKIPLHFQQMNLA